MGQLGPEGARGPGRERARLARQRGRRRLAAHQGEHARDRGLGLIDRRHRTARARHLEELAHAFQPPHVERVGGERAPDVGDLVVDRDQRALLIARRVVQRDQRARALPERIQLGGAPERRRRRLQVPPEITQDLPDPQVEGRALADLRET